MACPFSRSQTPWNDAASWKAMSGGAVPDAPAQDRHPIGHRPKVSIRPKGVGPADIPGGSVSTCTCGRPCGPKTMTDLGVILRAIGGPKPACSSPMGWGAAGQPRSAATKWRARATCYDSVRQSAGNSRGKPRPLRHRVAQCRPPPASGIVTITPTRSGHFSVDWRMPVTFVVHGRLGSSQSGRGSLGRSTSQFSLNSH